MKLIVSLIISSVFFTNVYVYASDVGVINKDSLSEVKEKFIGGYFIDPFKAIKVLNNYIRKNPDDYEAYKLRGNAYIDILKFNKATKDYRTALKKNNNCLIIYNNLASLYHFNKKVQLAEKYYLKAYSGDRNLQLPISNLAYLYIITGEYENADHFMSMMTDTVTRNLYLKYKKFKIGQSILVDETVVGSNWDKPHNLIIILEILLSQRDSDLAIYIADRLLARFENNLYMRSVIIKMFNDYGYDGFYSDEEKITKEIINKAKRY